MAYIQQRLKVQTWNFIQMLTNIWRHTERNSHDSSIYTFELCPFDLRKNLFLTRIKIVSDLSVCERARARARERERERDVII